VSLPLLFADWAMDLVPAKHQRTTQAPRKERSA
jgi:hypothetical protein